MSTPANIRCPACQGPLLPAALRCNACDLTLTGNFTTNEFASLGPDDLHFLRIFIHCEGRIRDMESALGVSYPTIKARLAKLKETLAEDATPVPAPPLSNPAQATGPDSADHIRAILKELDAGNLPFETAVQKLKHSRTGEEP